MSNDSSDEQRNNQRILKFAFGVVTVVAIVLLVLPPFPPWLRVLALLVVGIAALGVVGAFPRVRAAWRRVVEGLPRDDQRHVRWQRALVLIGLLIVALFLLPPVPPRARMLAVLLVALAALGGLLGILPRLRAMWHGLLGDLPSDNRRNG
jgi:phosphatidylglycerophosphate synthase